MTIYALKKFLTLIDRLLSASLVFFQNFEDLFLKDNKQKKNLGHDREQERRDQSNTS